MNVAVLVIDFSRVLIFAKADVPSLNRHHDKLVATDPGYRVAEHFYLNQELLDYLRELGQKVPIYLFTDGRLHKLPEFAPKLEGIFKGIISAEELGYKKNQSEAFFGLAYKLAFPPEAIVFIDDSLENVEAAKAAGIVAFQYTSNADTIKLLDAAR